MHAQHMHTHAYQMRHTYMQRHGRSFAYSASHIVGGLTALTHMHAQHMHTHMHSCMHSTCTHKGHRHMHMRHGHDYSASHLCGGPDMYTGIYMHTQGTDQTHAEVHEHMGGP